MSPLYLLAALLVGAVAYLWERARRADAEAKSKIAESQVSGLRSQVSHANAKIESYHRTLDFMREEAERLNEELKTCAVPGVVRERLNSLLTRASRPRF